MRNIRNLHTIFLISLLVGVMYFGVTLFIDILHNHQDITKFRDDCAACRWNDQSQDTSLSISSVQAFFVLPGLESKDYFFPGEPKITTHLYNTNFTTRPPPLI